MKVQQVAHVPGHESAYKHLQWTADGTCLLAATYDSSIHTYVVPVDLLDSKDKLHDLTAYSSIPSPDPVNAVTGVPFFNLQDPDTTLVLSSQRDHPIRLNSALTGDRIASYPLVNPLTEAYICPTALTFNQDGRHFVTGSESLLCMFDISVPGSEPLHTIRTGPKRLKDDRWNPSTSIRGIVSSLAIEPASNILAAGTFSRQIGLYDAGGVGECVTSFSTEGNIRTGIGGGGITQVSWSPCGRYLYVAERKSGGILCYDIRNTGKLLSWCQGRAAKTSQRLGFEVVSVGDKHEVWAGGTDGVVRVWSGGAASAAAADDDGQKGTVLPSHEFRVHTDPVTSTAVHRSGTVVATCAGRDHFRGDAATGGDDESGLKIWALSSE